MKKFVLLLILGVFTLLVVPAFKTMWDAFTPALLEDLTLFDQTVWTYFPYILLVFLLIMAVLIFRRN